MGFPVGRLLGNRDYGGKRLYWKGEYVLIFWEMCPSPRDGILTLAEKSWSSKETTLTPLAIGLRRRVRHFFLWQAGRR
jgi:hypothetical protein